MDSILNELPMGLFAADDNQTTEITAATSGPWNSMTSIGGISSTGHFKANKNPSFVGNVHDRIVKGFSFYSIILYISNRIIENLLKWKKNYFEIPLMLYNYFKLPKFYIFLIIIRIFFLLLLEIILILTIFLIHFGVCRQRKAL